jgi:hypothetical protein
LKHTYWQVEGDLNWQKVLKPTPICKKIATREKTSYSCDERGRWKRCEGWEKLGGWWNVTFDFIVRKNEP